MHHIVHGIEDVFGFRFTPVIAVGTVRGAVRLSAKSTRSIVQETEALLIFEDVLHHIGSGAAGNIFIHKNDAVCFLQRLNNAVMSVERKKSLHINHLNINTARREHFCGFESNSAGSTIGNKSNIAAFANHLGNTEFNTMFANVGGQCFFETIAVEHFNDKRRFIGS